MNELSNVCLFLLIALLVMACTSDASDKGTFALDTAPMDRLADNEAGNIVRKSIEGAGGWKNWADMKTLSYTKVIQRYDSAGSMEKEVRQLHQYQLHPLKIRFDWEDEGDQYTIINIRQKAWKFKNGQELTAEADVINAYNSSFGSHYTMCMPFKLTDPGTVLAYEGIDTLPNGQAVYAIKTTYEEGAGSAAGMHTWWYYFDKDTYTLAANFLDYGDGFSYTHYHSFADVQGITLNWQRESSAANADRGLKAARTVYINENIRFNEKLNKALFEPFPMLLVEF